jgi:TfoX/Sxy family transcriptional regulator of competence genes
MAFDEAVAVHLRKVLARRKGVTERKMFGGLAFLLDGNMCCGVLGDRIVLRLGAEGAAEALREPHTRPMDFTGRSMASMVYVMSEGYATEPALRGWVRKAVAFASSLPAKPDAPSP